MRIISSPVQSSPVQSVIISTYNRKEFLSDAINSVLRQSLKDIEVLVIDDCSTDDTEDLVKSIHDERVHYFRNDKNIGIEHNRNFGLKHAKGKYLTFLDDDDYYTDYDFFAKAINIFTEHENDAVPIVMVCANAEVMNTMTHETCIWDIGTPGRVRGLDYVLGKDYHKPPSTFPAVFRTEILRQAGLENKIIFDSLTYIEAALEGDAWFLHDAIGVYRVHGETMTLGYKATTPEREARHWETARENVRRWRHAAEVVRARTDKRTADRLYISTMVNLTGYYAIARPRFMDRMRCVKCVFEESGFMPKLWLMFPIYKLKANLRKITPLRKLYRFIKYRLRGKPYPIA